MFIIQIIRNSPDMLFAIAGVAGCLIAILGAIILHEIAHGLAALYNGDDTAKLMGRLTLNPAKHFNLVGFLMFLFVGFGFAKPVPVNSANFRNFKKGCIMVSIAGVVTNLLLAFLCTPLIALSVRWFFVAQSNFSVYLSHFFLYFTNYFAVININLALFNLLPLYPLDGYRLINCFVPSEHNALIFLRRYSLYILLALILLNNLNFFSPLDWYIGTVGGWIETAYSWFWGLFGLA